MKVTGRFGATWHTGAMASEEMIARDVRPLERLVPPPAVGGACRSPLGTFAECPLCGGDLFPEHAHFKCKGCGWRDSCCD